MRLFYGEKVGDYIVLKDEESNHAIRVMRKKIGDELSAVDGYGNQYKGPISHIDGKETHIRIVEEKEMPDLPYRLTVAIAPTKNLNKIEWFLEKATEIGVHAIIPITTTRTEKKRIKTERWNKIMLSAMKQSLQARLPRLMPLLRFSDLSLDSYDRIFIPYTPEEDAHLIKQDMEKGDNILVCIGPEGGWTIEEVNHACEHGAVCVSLGNTRLRTETAGVVACQIVKDLYVMKS